MTFYSSFKPSRWDKVKSSIKFWRSHSVQKLRNKNRKCGFLESGLYHYFMRSCCRSSGLDRNGPGSGTLTVGRRSHSRPGRSYAASQGRDWQTLAGKCCRSPGRSCKAGSLRRRRPPAGNISLTKCLMSALSSSVPSSFRCSNLTGAWKKFL